MNKPIKPNSKAKKPATKTKSVTKTTAYKPARFSSTASSTAANDVRVLGAVPKVFFSEKAWRLMQYYIHAVETEIGWLGSVERDGNNFYITNVYLAEQEVHGTETLITEDGWNRLAVELIADSATDPIAARALIDSVEDASDLSEVMSELFSNHGCDTSSVSQANSLRFWGHSHVNMAVNPSGTDDRTMEDFEDNKFEYMIRGIFNKKDAVRIDLFDYKRGLIFMNIDWSIKWAMVDDEETLKAEITQKVRKKTFQSQQTSGGYAHPYYGNQSQWGRNWQDNPMAVVPELDYQRGQLPQVIKRALDLAELIPGMDYEVNQDGRLVCEPADEKYIFKAFDMADLEGGEDYFVYQDGSFGFPTEEGDAGSSELEKKYLKQAQTTPLIDGKIDEVSLKTLGYIIDEGGNLCLTEMPAEVIQAGFVEWVHKHGPDAKQTMPDEAELKMLLNRARSIPYTDGDVDGDSLAELGFYVDEAGDLYWAATHKVIEKGFAEPWLGEEGEQDASTSETLSKKGEAKTGSLNDKELTILLVQMTREKGSFNVAQLKELGYRFDNEGNLVDAGSGEILRVGLAAPLLNTQEEGVETNDENGPEDDVLWATEGEWTEPELDAILVEMIEQHGFYDFGKLKEQYGFGIEPERGDLYNLKNKRVLKCGLGKPTSEIAAEQAAAE